MPCYHCATVKGVQLAIWPLCGDVRVPVVGAEGEEAENESEGASIAPRARPRMRIAALPSHRIDPAGRAAVRPPHTRAVASPPLRCPLSPCKVSRFTPSVNRLRLSNTAMAHNHWPVGSIRASVLSLTLCYTAGARAMEGAEPTTPESGGTPPATSLGRSRSGW